MVNEILTRKICLEIAPKDTMILPCNTYHKPMNTPHKDDDDDDYEDGDITVIIKISSSRINSYYNNGFGGGAFLSACSQTC